MDGSAEFCGISNAQPVQGEHTSPLLRCTLRQIRFLPQGTVRFSIRERFQLRHEAR
jgi:hypothetical protein